MSARRTTVRRASDRRGIGVEVVVRWRRDDRQQPDDSPDLPAEEWLSQFRPVRPDALTSADRDAAGQPAVQPPAAQARRDSPDAPVQPAGAGRDQRRDRPDDGRYRDDQRHGRPDDSRARSGAPAAGRKLEREARGPDRGTRPQPDRPDAASRETGRRVASGWDTSSGQVTSGWNTGSGQVAPSWEGRPDSYRQDDGYRPQQDGYRTPPEGQRPGAVRQGPDGSGERNRRAPGPDSQWPAYGERPAGDSYRAGPDPRYQARDGRGNGNRLASDGRSAYDGRGERDDYRRGQPSPAAGGDEYRRDGRGLAPERHAQRPELDPLPAERGGFRTDWEVLRAVRDGLRAEGPALGHESADRFGRDGIRPDASRRDVGFGRPDSVSGPRASERDSWAPHPGAPRERAYELPGPAVPDRLPSAGAGASALPRVSQPHSPPGSLDDDTLTRPLPVILPGATAVPRPAPVEAPRGPFEPARPGQPQPRPASITGSVDPPAETFAPAAPPLPGPPLRPIPDAATAKLDQIKDLYLTAEAIGEDALDRHFDQVSQRQRELIREFFERSGPGTEGR
jgi:hypothetical protein